MDTKIFSGAMGLSKSKAVLLVASMILALLLAFGVALVITAEEPAQAAFPGQNGKIVFASNRHGGWEIYTIGYAGNNLKRLTDNSAKNVTPSWSADGKRIAFSNGRRASATYDIFVMNADGSGKTRVTNEGKLPSTKQWGDYAPSFSPNGNRIAFIRLHDVYRIRTDGSNLTRLTSVDPAYTYISGPAWSPDGSKILFGLTDRFADSPSKLATLSPDGSNYSAFAYPDVGYIGTPDWAPDGSRVVFGSGGEIYETVEGGKEKPLTTNQTDDDDPAFSPDGSKIVYSSDRDGDYDLYIKNADGTGKPQRLTNAPGNDSSPSWQPIH